MGSVLLLLPGRDFKASVVDSGVVRDAGPGNEVPGLVLAQHSVEGRRVGS